MATKKAVAEERVSIPRLNIQSTVINVIGDSPLIMHKWSEKAKKEILDKQMGKAKAKKNDFKDPVRDFIDSMYWLEGEPDDEHKTEEGFSQAIQNGARFGFPSVAFKEAAIAAAKRKGVIKDKVSMYGAIRIPPEFIEIKAMNIGSVAGTVGADGSLDGKFVQAVPAIREDMVKVGGITKVADIRYRGMFENWCATIPVQYDADVLTLDQVVNMFNIGGFYCGIGEWRVERGGSFGAFHVEGA